MYFKVTHKSLVFHITKIMIIKIRNKKAIRINFPKMVNNVVTEIRNFFSLVELSEYIEQEISSCESIREEYGERLGSLLRKNEQTCGDNKEFKELSGLQKNSKSKKSDKKKKGKGKGKKKTKSGWINYNEIMLSTEYNGEAQILFEVIEQLKAKISRLEKIKDEIMGLKRLGLDENVVYMTYINEEIPEKIVLHKLEGNEMKEKFNFAASFSLTVQNE
ncbi:hypothetical protein AC477_03950 [miscellaneous Crenarchaeota group-1 archaeon SG8-32-1]|uniref:Uncharacterized protein n=1 Tax=miscellaneous Crenarchaeota group-1 archaeon SG8-32-1 TaxID=1685124 RepID=A0A0M0BSY7_9ARCH|nr:MAG: hypothetical protein AC477_03950 [miscellaneous Crenarchaeota group-1 archaeon SG8-32-1]